VAITSIKTGSSFTNLVKYNDFLAGNAAFSPSSYESIASVTANSGTTATFSSIPSTYSHLQIRGYGARNGGNGGLALRFNSDSGANYAVHYINGSGAAVGAFGDTAQNYLLYLGEVPPSTFDYKGVTIIDIIDYASTTKNKTVRSFSGNDRNGTGGDIRLSSGVWLSNAAVTSVTISLQGDTFATSTFALYGIKG
jgi:hypothetical protein